MSKEDVQCNLAMRFPVDHFKDGEYTLVIPLPGELLSLIGAIAVQWGAFELRMDAMIEMIIPRLHKKISGWKKDPFVKRKKLFHKLMEEYTSQLFPDETEVFKAIADKAGEVHWKRNAIVHGLYKIRGDASDESEPIKFFARAEHKRREVILEINKSNLEDIVSDIAHLGGNMMASAHRMGGSFSEREIILEDKQFMHGPPTGQFQPVPIRHEPLS